MQIPQDEEPTLLTIEETMKKLRVGRSKLYRMMGSEGLPADLLQEWIRERVQQRA
jgi:predicted DNA-binding transcriptional regulator AlpA